MDPISSAQLREILVKGWMTHDAMWFKHCLEQVGMEKTNLINRQAVRSMALVETKRLAKLLGVERVTNLDDLRAFVQGAASIIVADFMAFGYSFEPPDRMHCRMQNCFAHDGIKRLGVIDQYQCGIFTRVEAWLEGLGLSFTVEPRVTGCMLRQQGRCQRQYTITNWAA